MSAISTDLGAWADPKDDPAATFVARLTDAAYAVALRHGVKGSFADLELALWRELRAVVEAVTRPAAVQYAVVTVN
jgi:hypothetical protein